MKAPRVFTAYGQPLALEPKAFGMLLCDPPAPREPKVLDGGIGLVEVHGPLMHHADPFCDSYDDIKRRVSAAIDRGATKAVVLSIDSPGGLVSGAFDTADEIRAFCDASGVELVAFVDGQATSAGYALACVANRVFVPPTGFVGSIGVIDALIDATAQDRAFGLQFSIITSGARKSDGNPHTTTTDAAITSAQARVDDLAAIFFEHVSQRRGIAVDKVAGLEAGLVHGARAVALGLADDVKTYDQVLALLRGGDVTSAAASANTSNGASAMTEDEIRAGLQAIVDDEEADEKAKSRAKAALAAMSDDGEENADDESEASAEGDEEKPAEEASASNAIAALAARVSSLEASSAVTGKALEVEQRKALRASRPDVSAGVHEALGALSFAAYRDALAKIEKPKAPKPAATNQVSATRGAGQGAGASKPNELMARAMGLLPTGDVGVVRKDGSVTFNARRAAADGGAR